MHCVEPATLPCPPACLLYMYTVMCITLGSSHRCSHVITEGCTAPPTVATLMASRRAEPYITYTKSRTSCLAGCCTTALIDKHKCWRRRHVGSLKRSRCLHIRAIAGGSADGGSRIRGSLLIMHQLLAFDSNTEAYGPLQRSQANGGSCWQTIAIAYPHRCHTSNILVASVMSTLSPRA